jgi:hypothetical protein
MSHQKLTAKFPTSRAVKEQAAARIAEIKAAQARYDTNERLDKACKLVAAMTRKEHISHPFGGASVAVA